MSDPAAPSAAPRSALLARELAPDPRALVAHALADFEPLARERMHPASFDYVAGGSWNEETLADNEAAWRRHRLRPRMLLDVARVSTSTSFLGLPAAMPVATAPMASHEPAHPDGELATAAAAARVGVPFTLSTMSSRSIEAVAGAAPHGTNWFQLYVQADPAATRRLVERAATAGYRALVVTVDLPVLGHRLRDRRNGWELAVPFGNFAAASPGFGPSHRPDASGYDLLEEPAGTLTWQDLAAIRGWSSLPIVLKGILTAEDARLAVEHGADAIVVSNHGARQLDRVAAPVDVLEEVVDAVAGRTEVWVDGGVRSGLDIAVALGLGARGVLVGRPIMWALAAAGRAGVERALTVLREDFEIALRLLGAQSPTEITRAHVGP